MEHDLTVTNGSAVTIQGDTVITYTNNRRIQSVKILKVDDAGNPLSGIGFSFDGNDLTTGTDGYTGSVELPFGQNYTLTETSPKDHYVPLSNDVTVNVSSYGVVTVSTAEDDEGKVQVSGPVDGVYTIIVTNTRETYPVTITKLVTGNLVDLNREFNFTLKVTDGSDVQNYSFKLKNGQIYPSSGTLSVPYNAIVEITETAANQDGYTTSYRYRLSGSAGTVSGSSATVSTGIDFTVENSKSSTPDTGVDLDSVLPALLLGLTVTGGVSLLAVRRRRKEV